MQSRSKRFHNLQTINFREISEKFPLPWVQKILLKFYVVFANSLEKILILQKIEENSLPPVCPNIPLPKILSKMIKEPESLTQVESGRFNTYLTSSGSESRTAGLANCQ